MDLTIKKFMKIALEEDQALKRREIRCIKKEISWIDDMKKAVEGETEKDLKKLLDDDPKMLEKYEEMRSLVADRQKKEIKRMQKEGILREVLLDKEGNEIESVGTEDLSSVSKQSDSGESNDGNGGEDEGSGSDSE